MASHQRRLLLAVVATDRTFARRQGRSTGEGVRSASPDFWQGKCIHCGSSLVVELDGSAGKDVTLEHIFPRTHGGDNRLANLALACKACNNQKGIRQDPLKPGTPAFDAMVAFLRKRRLERWREPLAELVSCCEGMDTTPPGP